MEKLQNSGFEKAVHIGTIELDFPQEIFEFGNELERKRMAKRWSEIDIILFENEKVVNINQLRQLHSKDRQRSV